MKLRDVRSVVLFGDWATERGFIVGEGPYPYGPIDRLAHTNESLHYSYKALDINYRSGGPRGTEKEALSWLYHKVLGYKRKHPGFPLDELFFNGFGFIKERPEVNFPISNHENHLHIGFTDSRW